MDIRTSKKVPTTIGIRYPHPVSKFIATRALAAAGWCMVFVSDMRIKTITKEMIIINKLLPKILQIISPVKVERICPPITCLG